MQELFQTFLDHLSFVLTVLGIIVALALLAKLAEKTLFRDVQFPKGARRIAISAVCTAISGLLMLVEIPVFFAPGFYKADLSELPVLFCAFSLGPAAGVVCEALKVVVKLLLKGTTTAFVGDFANFAVGCTLVLPAAIVYFRHRTRKGAVAALAVGTLCMTVFGSVFNAFYLLPKFSQMFGLPLDAIVEMGKAVNPAVHSIQTLVLFAVAPLNLLKGAVVSGLTFALYKRVKRVLLP